MQANTRWWACGLLLVAVLVAGAIWRVEFAADRTRNPASERLLSSNVAASVPPSVPEPKPLPAASPQPPGAAERLETALLPLLEDVVAIPPSVELSPGSGGGMVVIGDAIIVVDVYGKFAIVTDKGRRIEKLILPDLPNGAADYKRLAAPPRTIEPGIEVNGGFVVHNMEYWRETAGRIRLFVSHEKFLPELGTTALAVSTILLGDGFAPAGPWESLYESQPLRAEWYSGVAGGGRMLVRGDELLVTVGDYNQDNVFMRSRLEAQNAATDFGKILSIDLRTRARTIVSMGHRNPEGLAVTSAGAVYATEHGPRGGDLLTRIVPGTNFGWPIVTLGTHYSSYRWPNRDADAGGATFSKPTYAWVPSIGVSNLIEVAGFDPAWNGDLLVGSLKARSLYRLRLDGEDRVVYGEPIWIGERIRDIKALADGSLVLLTDSAKLIFLRVDAQKLATDKREWPPVVRPPQTGCQGCH